MVGSIGSLSAQWTVGVTREGGTHRRTMVAHRSADDARVERLTVFLEVADCMLG